MAVGGNSNSLWLFGLLIVNVVTLRVVVVAAVFDIAGDHRERMRRIKDDHADRVLRRVAAHRALDAASPAARNAALAVVKALSDHRQETEHRQGEAISAQRKQGR